MDRPKIGAREAAMDIKSGMTDADLMEKYKLTSKGLESLFRKLVEAKLLEESFLARRGAPKAPEPNAGSGQASRRVPQSKKDEIEEPSELELAILQDIKDGKHDNEIMRRHEMSPGKLKQVRESLARSGLLVEADTLPSEDVKTAQCPFCSAEIKASAAKCPHCGSWLEPRSADEPGSATAATGPLPPVEPDEEPPDEDKECPWEERENYGTIKAYIQTATKCLLTPTRFFSKLPTQDGYFSPILFAAMTLPISIMISYLWLMLFRGGGIGGLIVMFIIMSIVFVSCLIFMPIFLVVLSGLLHVSLSLLGGAREGYQATFRVVSYSTITSLFGVIPFVGNLATLLWGLVLTVIGLRETHKTTTGKAAAAVAIPVVIGVILAFLLGIAGLMTASKLASSARDLPVEACLALDTYIARVDEAAGLDAREFESELQAAVRDFLKELEPFRRQPSVLALQQKAILFGIAASQQAKGGTKSGLDMDQLREDLRKMCGK